MGLKKFDRRIEDDKTFNIGDWLRFVEIDQYGNRTGNSCYCECIWIMRGSEYNHEKEVVISIEMRFTNIYLKTTKAQIVNSIDIDAGSICKFHTNDIELHKLDLYKAIQYDSKVNVLFDKDGLSYATIEPNTWEFHKSVANEHDFDRAIIFNR